MTQPAITYQPLTSQNWQDLEALFGPSGAYSGCWCMFWRTSRAEFSRRGNEGNRQDFKALVDKATPTGILAYVDGQPAGWVSVAPRETYPSLERSRVLKRIDNQPVWSIVCFYVGRDYRRTGVMAGLIRAAVDFAASQGARHVEAYPTDPAVRSRSPAEAYMGVLPAFERAGFVEVARPRPGRAIMRHSIH